MNQSARVMHALGLTLALLLASAVSVRPTSPAPKDSVVAPVGDEEFPTQERDGQTLIRDKSGHWVTVAPFRRIVSGSTLADELLLEFCEPDRIVAFTSFSSSNTSVAHRYAGKPHLSALDDLEGVLTLRPDLLLMNTLSSEARVARLREAGVPVFDLGEMRGVDTYLANARVIARLLGRPALGDSYAARFRQRLERVRPNVSPAERPLGLYLSVFGTSLYGGGARTSYDDVLRYAGLENVLAPRHEGWPELDPEEVLRSSPDVIVTHTNMGIQLCRLPGFHELRPCAGDARGIIELPPSILSDPGAAMLVATETIAETLRARGTLRGR